MKKLLSFMTAAVMGIGTIGFMPETFPDVSIHASAAESGTCGDNLTWTLDGNGKINTSDASYILTYYAQFGAGLNPSWENILKK